MKSLYKNLSIYGTGNILSKGINIILVPVYTAYLTLDYFGALELLTMTASITLMFFCFNINSGYIRVYYDDESRKGSFTSLFFFSLTSTILVASIFFALSDILSSLLFDFADAGYLFRLIILSTGIHSVSLGLYSHLQVRQRAFMFMLANILTLLITLIMTIIFVVFLGLGLEGILYAKLTGMICEFIILFSACYRGFHMTVSYSFIIDMLKFSIPLIPGQLAAFLLNYVDRIFLNEYRSLGDVGIYSLAYRISSILLILTIFPISKSFGPFIFSLIKDPDQLKESFRKFTRFFIGFSLSLTLLLSIFSREIILLFANRDYLDARYIVFILCLSYVLYGLHAITSFAFHITKKTWIMSIIMAIAAGVNIALNFMLVPHYGIWGASIATLLSFFVVLILKFIIIHHTYPIAFEYYQYFLIFISASVIYYFASYLTSNVFTEFIPGLAARIILFFVFLFYIYLSSFIKKDEFLEFRGYFIAFYNKYLKGFLRR